MNSRPHRFANIWFMTEDSFRRIKSSNILDLSNIRATGKIADLRLRKAESMGHGA